MSSSKYVKVCPKCGSTEVKIPPAGMDVLVTQPDYCIKCGNKGIFPEVKEKDLEDFKKKIKK